MMGQNSINAHRARWHSQKLQEVPTTEVWHFLKIYDFVKHFRQIGISVEEENI